MLTFTLDTNCIIEVDADRAEAEFVKALANAHREGTADVAVVAVSASERQQGDTYLETYDQFRDRLQSLDLGHLTEVQGLAYFGFSYWNHALWSSPETLARERAVHEILFPAIPYDWGVFANACGVDINATRDPRAKRWRNAFCDRQMFWAHDHAKRDIFVTRDTDFSVLEGNAAFPTAKILSPKEAAALL